VIEDFVQVSRGRLAALTRLTFTDERGEASLGGAGTDAPFLLLTKGEVRDLIERLEAALDPERNTNYVQVQVSGASTTYPWTYIDPSGELEVGDRVLVPFGYDDAERVAKVTALGKGDVPAKARIKRVAARLEVEVLEAA
jgi:hypothetical protein